MSISRVSRTSWDWCAISSDATADAADLAEQGAAQLAERHPAKFLPPVFGQVAAGRADPDFLLGLLDLTDGDLQATEVCPPLGRHTKKYDPVSAAAQNAGLAGHGLAFGHRQLSAVAFEVVVNTVVAEPNPADAVTLRLLRHALFARSPQKRWFVPVELPVPVDGRSVSNRWRKSVTKTYFLWKPGVFLATAKNPW